MQLNLMNFKEQIEKNWLQITIILVGLVLAYSDITNTLEYHQERINSNTAEIIDIKDEQVSNLAKQNESYQEIIQRLARIEEKLSNE